MSHTAGNLLIHLIFSTKNRRPLITPEIRNDLFAYLGGIIREMHGAAPIINGTADHVHMLIRIRPHRPRLRLPASSKPIPQNGSARNGTCASPGRQGMEPSAPANRMSPPSPATSRPSKTTTKS